MLRRSAMKGFNISFGWKDGLRERLLLGAKQSSIVSQGAKRSQSQSRLGEVRLRVVIKQFHELLGKDTKLSDIWSQQTHLVEDRR